MNQAGWCVRSKYLARGWQSWEDQNNLGLEVGILLTTAAFQIFADPLLSCFLARCQQQASKPDMMSHPDVTKGTRSPMA